jgi:hypothetical protein
MQRKRCFVQRPLGSHYWDFRPLVAGLKISLQTLLQEMPFSLHKTLPSNMAEDPLWWLIRTLLEKSPLLQQLLGSF